MGIDATTLEATAAVRSIVRCDNGDTYLAFLLQLAQAWLSDHARAIHGLIRPPVDSHDARISLHDGVVFNLSVGTHATGC